MQFKQITDGEQTVDFFIDPNDKLPQINIQDLVKDALQNNKGRKKVIDLPDFTIYRHKPPYIDKEFLKYVPDHNGKYFTKVKPILVNGKEFHPGKSPETRYGTFWYQVTPLSEARIAEVLVQQSEQRENRRHIGDRPSAT